MIAHFARICLDHSWHGHRYNLRIRIARDTALVMLKSGRSLVVSAQTGPLCSTSPAVASSMLESNQISSARIVPAGQCYALKLESLQ